MSKGIIYSSITFLASGNKVNIEWIQGGNVSNFVNYVERYMGEKPAVGIPVPDKAKAIRELAELKSQGALTDEEFQEQKRKILST